MERPHRGGFAGLRRDHGRRFLAYGVRLRESQPGARGATRPSRRRFISTAVELAWTGGRRGGGGQGGGGGGSDEGGIWEGFFSATGKVAIRAQRLAEQRKLNQLGNTNGKCVCPKCARAE